jgi:hypothetical protein
MSQRGTSAMILFLMASLIAFGECIYEFVLGRGIDWRGILIGAAMVAAGIYFKSAKDPA